MTVTPFPGSVSARNALTSRTATEEQRAAARELGRRYATEDLIFAAPGDPVRSTRALSDAELATFMPFIARKSDRFPPLRPAVRENTWDMENVFWWSIAAALGVGGGLGFYAGLVTAIARMANP